MKQDMKIPGILRWTPTIKRLKHYMATELSEVKHTTLNPDGPGAIRIHLVPPREESEYFTPSVAIINGTDIVPVNFVWAICSLNSSKRSMSTTAKRSESLRSG